jgi:hypothetical protein
MLLLLQIPVIAFVKPSVIRTSTLMRNWGVTPELSLDNSRLTSLSGW